MFYVYNITTKSVEKVEKIDPSIHRHRNTKEEFTFSEEKIEGNENESRIESAKKIGRSKSK